MMKIFTVLLPMLALVALATCKSPTAPSEKSSPKAILSIDLELGKTLGLDPDAGENYYKVVLPYATNWKNLDLKLEVSPGAEYEPEGEQDFTEGAVEFTVTAEDGTTQIYFIKVERLEPRTGKKIEGIDPELGKTLDRDPEAGENYYKVVLPYATNWENLDLKLEVSDGAEYEPKGERDFTEGAVEFTVTAEDSTTQIYFIKVERLEPRTGKKIEGIDPELGKTLDLDPEAGENYYKVVLPFTTNWENLDLKLVVSDGAEYEPKGERDFTKGAQQFTVTAEDGTTQSYFIKVELLLRTGKAIQAIDPKLGKALIDDPDADENHYKLILPHDTTADLESLDLKLVVSPGAEYEPEGELDFTKGAQPFTVTAEDGTTQIYSITVEILEPRTGKAIERIGSGLGGATLNDDSGAGKDHYWVSVPTSANLESLDLKLVVSPGAEYEPEGELDFTKEAQPFTVTAEDGTTQSYVIRVEGSGSQYRVKKDAQGSWQVADPQDEEAHTGIWLIDDLARVGSGVNESDTGGDIWKLTDDYVLMADLDFNEEADYRDKSLQSQFTPDGTGNEGWNPIGSSSNKFQGDFESNRKTISNLYINRLNGYIIGLFGDASGATIKQLGLIDVNVHGNQYVGGLMGRGENIQIEQVYVTGEIRGSNYAGGLLGYLYGDSTISESYVKGTVTGGSDKYMMVGYLSGSLTISNSIAQGNLDNIAPSGTTLSHTRIISDAEFRDPAYYSDSDNFDPSWDFDKVWGIKPEASRPTFIGSSDFGLNSATRILSIDETLGGQSPLPDPDSSHSPDAYTVGVSHALDLSRVDISPRLSFGARYRPTGEQDFSNGAVKFTVTAQDGKTEKDYWITLVPVKSYRVKKDAQGSWQVADPQDEEAHTGIWKIDDLARVGSGVNESDTGGDIWKLADDYVLMADLDFNKEADYTDKSLQSQFTPDENGNEGWKPIGKYSDEFQGDFEGNRKTISNLYINRLNSHNIGLFGDASGATIKQLGLINVNVHGKSSVGGLMGIGRENIQIEQVYVTGEIRGSNHAGGLLGYSYDDSTISESYVKGTVTGSQYLMVGTPGNSLTIRNSIAQGNLDNIAPSGTTLSHTWIISDAEFRDPAYYSNTENFDPSWDFDKVWGIKPEASRPTFIGSSDLGLNREARILNIDETLGGQSLLPDPDSSHSPDAYTVGVSHALDLSRVDINPRLSFEARYSPTGKQDFSNGAVKFTVTAQDGKTEKDYWITLVPVKFYRVEKDTAQGSWQVADPQGEGTHTGIWKIDDLARVGSGVNEVDTGGNIWRLADDYVLMADLDFNKEADYTNQSLQDQFTPDENGNEGWKPIGKYSDEFQGDFEGNRKTISNLYINRPEDSRVGFFGDASGATIKQLGLIDVNVHGGSSVGGLMGFGKNIQIEQVYVTGEIRGINNVGGLLGYLYGDNTISESYVRATVTGDNNTHMMVGSLPVGSLTISNSIAQGNLDSIAPSGTTLFHTWIISDAEFKDPAYYSDSDNFDLPWDFDKVWEIKPEASRPTFIGSSDPGSP